MQISNFDATVFALTPGLAEIVERHPMPPKLGHITDLAKWVREERDNLFSAVTWTITATTGAAYFNDMPVVYYPCVTATILGIGLSVIVSKKLYDTTKCLQTHLNNNLAIRVKLYESFSKPMEKESNGRTIPYRNQ